MPNYSKSQPNPARIAQKTSPIVMAHIKKLNPKSATLPSYEDVADEEQSGLAEAIIELWEHGHPHRRRLEKAEIMAELRCSEWLVKHTLLRAEQEGRLKRKVRER